MRQWCRTVNYNMIALRYYLTLPDPQSQHSRFTCRTVLHQPTFQCFRSSKRGQNMAACALDLSSPWPRDGFRQYFPLPTTSVPLVVRHQVIDQWRSWNRLCIDCALTLSFSRISYWNVAHMKRSEYVLNVRHLFPTSYIRIFERCDDSRMDPFCLR
jgi:hypothetical protein